MITSVINKVYKVYKATVEYDIDIFGHSAFPVAVKFPGKGDIPIVPVGYTAKKPMTCAELLNTTTGRKTPDAKTGFEVGQNIQGNDTVDTGRIGC